MRHLPALLVFLLSWPLLAAAAPEVVAVTPGSAQAGSVIAVDGGPFSAEVQLVIGTLRVRPNQVSTDRLLFTTPALPAGDYLLSAEQNGQASSRALTLRIIEPEPRIAELSPATIDACSTPAERRLLIRGQGFLPGAQALLDGAVVGAERHGEGEIVLTPPPLAGGVHQVQVVNPGNRRSLPQALYISSVPEIDAVVQGADNVISYELIVQGKNFLYNSQLVVDGTPVNPHQLTDSSGSLLVPLSPPQGDGVRYIDCRTIVYKRRPATRQLKRVSLQVINPGGEQSPVYHVTIP